MSTERQGFDDVFKLMEGAEGLGDLARRAIARAKALAIWEGPVEPRLQPGGISNLNLIVEDAGRKFVIRIGEDEPHLGINRANEANAYRAAAAAGVAPEVVHTEPGLIVAPYIEGKVLTPADARARAYLPRIARLLRRLHDEAHRHLDGHDFMFWPFHHARWYIRQARAHEATLEAKWLELLPGVLGVIDEIEAAGGPVRVVFAHNDIQPQNFIDDGRRLWLVDWEYAGYGADLFDLGMTGMVTDITPGEATVLLESYYESPVDDELRKRFEGYVVLACIREMTWSFLAEVTPRPVDFDWRIYSNMNYERYLKRLAVYRGLA